MIAGVTEVRTVVIVRVWGVRTVGYVFVNTRKCLTIYMFLLSLATVSSAHDVIGPILDTL